jgi:hypothetical protein
MKHPNHFLAKLNQSSLQPIQMYIIYLLLSVFFITKPTNTLHQLELDERNTKPLQVVEGGIGGSGLILSPLPSLNT